MTFSVLTTQPRLTILVAPNKTLTHSPGSVCDNYALRPKIQISRDLPRQEASLCKTLERYSFKITLYGRLKTP